MTSVEANFAVDPHVRLAHEFDHAPQLELADVARLPRVARLGQCHHGVEQVPHGEDGCHRLRVAARKEPRRAELGLDEDGRRGQGRGYISVGHGARAPAKDPTTLRHRARAKVAWRDALENPARNTARDAQPVAYELAAAARPNPHVLVDATIADAGDARLLARASHEGHVARRHSRTAKLLSRTRAVARSCERSHVYCSNGQARPFQL